MTERRKSPIGLLLATLLAASLTFAGPGFAAGLATGEATGAAADRASDDAATATHGATRTLAELPIPVPVPGTALPPAVWLVLAALAVALLPASVRGWVAIAAPAAVFVYVLRLDPGAITGLTVADYDLTLLRVDRLSRLFGLIFALVSTIAGIYAWHMRERAQQVAALLYGAGAIGVTFAGDLLTLYVFWELMAIASTVLIWARRTPESEAAGRRYVLVHLFGGAILLGGILMHLNTTGSIAFTSFAPGSGGLGAVLILIGFALNAAVVPLGAWLPDSYPKATLTGAVYCSALTTKTAVYVLLRGFHGWDVLIVAGVVMALWGVVYAVLANDIRELLAYHIISQVGYMVAGIGIGTELALNGAAAHAVCHILYKSVLFMGAGAVIHTTGRDKLTDLGGFVRRQKLVFGLYMIGAFSISGFPLFNGFISKSMVTAAAHEGHLEWTFLLLMLASVGTFLHTGLKLPYGVWFGPTRDISPTPTPRNMIVALAVGGGLCALLGVWPDLLYGYLPFPVTWRPYTAAHLVEMIQLLAFTYFAFYLFIPQLGGKRTLSVDTDVVYRKGAAPVRRLLVDGVGLVFDRTAAFAAGVAGQLERLLQDPLDWLPTSMPRRPSDQIGYDEDRDRRPFGLSLLMTLVVLVGLAIWTLLPKA